MVGLLCRPTPPGRVQTPLSSRDPTPLWQPSQANNRVVGAALSREKARINRVLMGNSKTQKALAMSIRLLIATLQIHLNPRKGMNWDPNSWSCLPKGRRGRDSACLEIFEPV